MVIISPNGMCRRVSSAIFNKKYMGDIKKPEKVKLVVAMITSNVQLFAQAAKTLSKTYGLVDLTSEILPFNKTDYYQKEMGEKLKRQFISFTELIFPDTLPDIKVRTNALEFELSGDSSQRKINLDPGYLDLAKLVLATTKDHQHRLYLGKGIYGEVTLRYRNKTFAPWEWTYPDYVTSEYIEIFHQIRQIYQEQMKNMSRKDK